MKKIFLILFIISVGLFLFAQKDTQPYFQQEVNYNIEVSLDDVNHILVGEADIEYINNSPDELDKIYFHLWANAYKNDKTAFAKQQIKNGSTDFFFSKNTERGGYDKVDFEINGQSATWSYAEEHIDIAIISLNKKLRPNESLQIRVPFQIKIPKYFSRMGHEQQAYYISQWYPKPAVYDRAGWHPMPYLDMGEFYSEFGKYDVKITIPQNYVVASTGNLETKSEVIFLENKVRATNKFINEKYPRGADRSIPLFEKDTFPTSSSEMKTIHYTAENVHDFAWFADKRFFVQKSRVEVGPNNKVDTWAFFNKEEFDLWLNATKYIDQSVKFYSQKVGMYPYPHATAVSNPYADAGAMEYPMITLVDQMYTAKSLDVVIAHEVGHNWFYGILGFNERDYPWMDEGINSYYERQYVKNFYPDGKDDFLPKFMQAEGQLDVMEAAKVAMERENIHQAINTPIHEMTDMNYNFGVYDRAADVLKTKITPIKMKSFFKEWKFKHPQPEDFIQHFNTGSDEVFNELMNTSKKIDYKIISVSKSDGYDLKISNKNGVALPFKLSMTAGKRKHFKLIDGFVGEKIIHIPPHQEGLKIDKFIIDKDREIPDVNRKNNTIRTSGIFRKVEPLQLKFLGGIENPTRSTVYWMPALGWNDYDKTMLGVVLHNNDLLPRKFEFVVAPMYGFASKNFVGTGVVKYNLYPTSSLFQRVTLSLNAKRFTYRYDWEDKFYDDYIKIAPKLEFQFKEKDLTSTIQHRVSFRYINILRNDGLNNVNKNNYYVNELKYSFEDSKVTSPLNLDFTAHQGDGFVRLFANYRQFIPHKKKRKGTILKAFVGWLPQSDNPSALVSFTFGGITNDVSMRDYLFDETLLGRSSSDGIFSQQRFNRDADLKTLSSVGNSQKWMVGLGVSTSIPGPLPVRPYVDAAIYQGFDLVAFEEATLFSYSSGIAIVGIPDAIEIYIPFFESNDITESLTYQIKDTFFKRISFLIDINNLQKQGKEFIKLY